MQVQIHKIIRRQLRLIRKDEFPAGEIDLFLPVSQGDPRGAADDPVADGVRSAGERRLCRGADLQCDRRFGVLFYDVILREEDWEK